MHFKSLMLTAAAGLALAPAAFAERASDGEVKIIYWQAPSILNPFLSGGTKDVESASLVIEPLARYCLLYTSPSPRDQRGSRMPSSA